MTSTFACKRGWATFAIVGDTRVGSAGHRLPASAMDLPSLLLRPDLA